MNAAKNRPVAEAKRIIGFKLPVSLIRQIKDEATASGCWPNKIVEQMARDHFERQAQRPTA